MNKNTLKAKNLQGVDFICRIPKQKTILFRFLYIPCNDIARCNMMLWFA